MGDMTWMKALGDIGSLGMLLFLVWYVLTRWGPQLFAHLNQTRNEFIGALAAQAAASNTSLSSQRTDFLNALNAKRDEYRQDMAAIRAEQKQEMKEMAAAFRENTKATQALTSRIEQIINEQHKRRAE